MNDGLILHTNAILNKSPMRPAPSNAQRPSKSTECNLNCLKQNIRHFLRSISFHLSLQASSIQTVVTEHSLQVHLPAKPKIFARNREAEAGLSNQAVFKGGTNSDAQRSSLHFRGSSWRTRWDTSDWKGNGLARVRSSEGVLGESIGGLAYLCTINVGQRRVRYNNSKW
jgi:hypothetical protein